MVASKEVKAELFLSNLNGIYALKEEQRATLKAFLCEKEVFTSLHTGFDNTDQLEASSFHQLAQIEEDIDCDGQKTRSITFRALPPLFQIFSKGSLRDVNKLSLCENI